MKRDRTVKTLFAIASILLLMGAGNLLLGQNRLARYQVALSAANQELAIATQASQDSETGTVVEEVSNFELNVDRQTRLIQSIKARLDFYALVALGGRCMLAFGGICLLGILLHRGITSPNSQ